MEERLLSITRTTKVKGSTLMEVLVAMVIVLICMTTAILIFLNISKRSNPTKMLHASQFAESVIERTKQEKKYEDGQYNQSGLTAYLKVDFYKHNQDLGLLLVEVYDNSDNLIITKKEVVSIQERE